MRPTLEIADDELITAKNVARSERKPFGQDIDELARRASAQGCASVGASNAEESATAQTGPPTVSDRITTYCIHPLPAWGALVSNEMIDRLREADNI